MLVNCDRKKKYVGISLFGNWNSGLNDDKFKVMKIFVRVIVFLVYFI